MKKTTKLCLILTALLLNSSMTFAAEPKILDIANNKTITFAEMIQDLRGADYIFLGDDITVNEHQIAQMEILEAIYEDNKKLVVGVEAFRSGNQYILDEWSSGMLKKHIFAEKFNANWGDWNRYRKLFQYVRNNNIKLAGLNIPKEILLQVELEGFDSLSASQLGGLEEGIVCNVVPGYQDVMRRMHLYKGIFKKQSFENYCEMQILGDIMMAKNLMEFHEKHPDFTVIVLAGNVHSWKRGIPNRITTKTKINSKIILFEAEGRITRNKVSIAEADYLWLDYGATGWRL